MPEGHKTKHMVALNSIVASVPVREYTFVFNDANAGTRKRGKEGGEADIKMLGAYGRDVSNENGKLLLGFAGGNKLALRTEHFYFCTLKGGAAYRFQGANRRKGQARLEYILTKQVDRRLVRCVNVHRPPLDAPKSDHNLVYAKVHIPRRSATNRRKGDNTKETPKTANLKQLMVYPNLRCQVANATVTALLLTPDGNCISDIATDMTDVMLSTAAELAPRSKNPRGAQGWCTGPGVETKMNTAWQRRDEARRRRRAEPHIATFEKP